MPRDASSRFHNGKVIREEEDRLEIVLEQGAGRIRLDNIEGELEDLPPGARVKVLLSVWVDWPGKR